MCWAARAGRCCPDSIHPARCLGVGWVVLVEEEEEEVEVVI